MCLGYCQIKRAKRSIRPIHRPCGWGQGQSSHPIGERGSRSREGAKLGLGPRVCPSQGSGPAWVELPLRDKAGIGHLQSPCSLESLRWGPVHFLQHPGPAPVATPIHALPAAQPASQDPPSERPPQQTHLIKPACPLLLGLLFWSLLPGRPLTVAASGPLTRQPLWP